MPDLLRMIAFWWKKLALLVIASVVITTIILLLQTRLYLSMVTALPANSATLDKARIFNTNVEQLYPEIGTADELDKFLGIAALGSLYYELVNEHDLPAHYKLDEEDAAIELRSRITVTRSKWNDLKIKAWDEDPQMAARLANAFLAKAETLYQNLQQQNNRIILKRLQQDLSQKEKQLQQLYTASAAPNQLDDLKKKGLEHQVSQLQQLSNEYALSVDTPLPLLLVAEQAAPALKPDKPKVLQTLAFVIFASLVFGMLVILFIESRKKHGQQTL